MSYLVGFVIREMNCSNGIVFIPLDKNTQTKQATNFKTLSVKSNTCYLCFGNVLQLISHFYCNPSLENRGVTIFICIFLDICI